MEKGSLPHSKASLPPWLWTLLPVAVVLFLSFLNRRIEMEDGLIYLRYVRNLLEGNGLVYNPGELFNGLTSPLYAALLAVGGLLLRNLPLTAVLLCTAAFAFAAVTAGALFARSRREAAVTGVVIASFGFFYSTYGMETALFLALIALSLRLHQTDSRYLPLALALTALTRYEGALLALPVAVDHLRRRRWPDPRVLAVAAAVFLAPFVFNLLYYGDPLPATLSAKVGQGKSGYWGKGLVFFDMRFLVRTVIAGCRPVGWLLLLLAGHGVWLGRKDRTSSVAAWFMLLLLLFYAGLNVPNYHWYYAPFFLLMLVYACRSVGNLSARLLARGSRRLLRGAAFLLLAAAVAFSLTRVVSFQQRGRHEGYARIGEWLAANTPANASVAMVEVGTVGWYSRRPIVDILGLVSPHNAAFIARGDLHGWLGLYRPDYILRHEPRFRVEEGAWSLQERGLYLPVPGFDFPGYVLLKRAAGE